MHECVCVCVCVCVCEQSCHAKRKGKPHLGDDATDNMAKKGGKTKAVMIGEGRRGRDQGVVGQLRRNKEAMV